MQIPKNFTDYLFEREAFHVCPLLTESQFERFCKERKLNISRDRLRKLESLRVFMPVLRINRPDVTIKIKLVDEDRKYRDLGVLADDEDWTGDTKIELASFDLDMTCFRNWKEHGCAWDPRNSSFDQASIVSEPRRHIAYYSKFQIHELRRLLGVLTLHVEMESYIENDGLTPIVPKFNTAKSSARCSQAIIQMHRDNPNIDIGGLLCQAISNRYFPHTQTDERRFTLSTDGRWDWYDFVADWSADRVIDDFQLTAGELERIYETLACDQDHVDPLANWYSLVRFVSNDKRKRLKGDALQAMTLREMAIMVRMLYRDAFGELLPNPHDVGRTIVHRIPDIEPEDDPLRALELVANDFHVNPKPQLVLFVEGATEWFVIPEIMRRLYGFDVSRLGIELVNLRGIGNMTGTKENPGSALWRLIDYLHHHQTIAMVLADNEGLIRNIQHGLTKKNSLLLSDRRVTRAEYVKIWKQSFEFDNFNNGEILSALQEMGDQQISKEGVIDARIGNIPLGKIFKQNTGNILIKPDLGKLLVEKMFDIKSRREPRNRPIARFLCKVVKLASLNHQPSTDAMSRFNQLTGVLGTLNPGAIGKRKRPR